MDEQYYTGYSVPAAVTAAKEEILSAIITVGKMAKNLSTWGASNIPSVAQQLTWAQAVGKVGDNFLIPGVGWGYQEYPLPDAYVALLQQEQDAYIATGDKASICNGMVTYLTTIIRYGPRGMEWLSLVIALYEKGII